MREALERLVSEFDQYHDGASNDHHLRLAVESAREALASEPESVELWKQKCAELEQKLHELWGLMSPDLWYWETDGDNDLSTLTCPVVIDAQVLSNLLATHAKPPELDGWHWMCSCGESGHIGPKDFCPACGNAIEVNRPWAYIGKPTGESE